MWRKDRSSRLSPIMTPRMTIPAPYGSPSCTRSKLAATMTPHAMALASAPHRADRVPVKKKGRAPRPLAAAMNTVSTNTASADTSWFLSPAGAPGSGLTFAPACLWLPGAAGISWSPAPARPKEKLLFNADLLPGVTLGLCR